MRFQLVFLFRAITRRNIIVTFFAILATATGADRMFSFVGVDYRIFFFAAAAAAAGRGFGRWMGLPAALFSPSVMYFDVVPSVGFVHTMTLLTFLTVLILLTVLVFLGVLMFLRVLRVLRVHRVHRVLADLTFLTILVLLVLLAGFAAFFRFIRIALAHIKGAIVVGSSLAARIICNRCLHRRFRRFQADVGGQGTGHD